MPAPALPGSAAAQEKADLAPAKFAGQKLQEVVWGRRGLCAKRLFPTPTAAGSIRDVA